MIDLKRLTEYRETFVGMCGCSTCKDYFFPMLDTIEALLKVEKAAEVMIHGRVDPMNLDKGFWDTGMAIGELRKALAPFRSEEKRR